jgi:hypothetical protein
VSNGHKRSQCFTQFYRENGTKHPA